MTVFADSPGGHHRALRRAAAVVFVLVVVGLGLLPASRPRPTAGSTASGCSRNCSRWPKRQRIESRLFDTLTNQIAQNGDARKTLVMKIDIEGAEVASVMATSDWLFSRSISSRWRSRAPTNNFWISYES